MILSECLRHIDWSSCASAQPLILDHNLQRGKSAMRQRETIQVCIFEASAKSFIHTQGAYNFMELI